ncbi:hypothetical protein NX02_03560 [Sphingomonas sanxanigenens DSM 19645 = NX02]|uniref:HTH lacI-type domain-containing protein n=2 Tax=Sphingomonas sanxanigenens TaxID=397260 RepID=W0A5Z6_9SPHN|nr:hypothetical protein NX02_03560 [Sphingomonas sanxanigenens DSM 19645 = NX02]
MTVSNVINGVNRASEATVATVRAAIAELGYVPNLAARRLAKAHATTVGLVYCNRRTPFLDAVLVGSLRATNAHGLQLTLRGGEGADRAEAERMAQDLVRAGADALLLIPPVAELLSGSAALAALNVPVAAIATGTRLPGVTTVRIDNRAAMVAITERVMSRGHRRIAYVAGPDAYSVVQARLGGFRAALAAHGLDEDPELVLHGLEFDHAAGLFAGRVLLERPAPPSAIICTSDDLAAGVIAHANHLGLRLPADLAVTGFDDTIVASRIWPPLTVVGQPVEDMAHRATQCLIAALDGMGSATTADELFEHSIVERESTSMAPRPQPITGDYGWTSPEGRLQR